MGELTQDRIVTVQKLLDHAPDEAVDGLLTALSAESGADRATARLRELIAATAMDRRLRNDVLSPLAPLFTPPSDIARLSFPADVRAQLWRALKQASPELVADAADLDRAFWTGPAHPPVYDEICRDAAEGLRTREDPAFAELAARIDAPPGQADRLATLLALAPRLLEAVEKLPSWLINQGGEHDAAIRLAFMDADEAGQDTGFLYMETLFAHLEEPAQILRLISVVMDRPTDRYVAASELASFGVRLLDSIDASLDAVRLFDPRRGLEGGVAVAAAAAVASARLHEFEQHIALAKEGVWGARVTSQRRSLALTMEMRLREMESAVFTALPAHTVRAGAKRHRGAAIVDAEPDAFAVDRAMALMALLDGCRASAAQAGFAALRAKVVEGLELLLDSYTQELLDLLRRAEAGSERAFRIRAFLDVAAEFLSLVRDPQSAELVRRRAAAA